MAVSTICTALEISIPLAHSLAAALYNASFARAFRYRTTSLRGGRSTILAIHSQPQTMLGETHVSIQLQPSKRLLPGGRFEVLPSWSRLRVDARTDSGAPVRIKPDITSSHVE